MRDGHRGFLRSHATGIAGTAVVLAVAGGITFAQAASPDASAFVAITPCRMVDTRPAAGIGARQSPLNSAETVTFNVRGTNGGCTIPAEATGLAANVTVLDGTASSFLQIWPADIAAAPNASTNNWTAGHGPDTQQG